MERSPDQQPEHDPWELPPDFVFDESFVKGGVHEPPARTRASIARYGGERTSWRHGGLAATPVAPGPATARPHRRGRGRSVALLLAAFVVVGAVLFGVSRLGPHSAPAAPVGLDATTRSAIATVSQSPIADSPSAATAAPTPTTPDVLGITPGAAVGTCYSSPNASGAVSLSLMAVSCGRPHTFELVAHEIAQGDDTTYPAQSYWNGAVAQTCYRDLLTYTGLARAQWPATLTSTEFTPTSSGWAAGDRGVYCLALSTPPTATSVRKKAG